MNPGVRLCVLCALFCASSGWAQEPQRWVAGASVLFGESGPHGQSLDGVLSGGWKAGDSAAFVMSLEGEQGLSSVQPFAVVSYQAGIRLIGDRLGGLAGPIEFTLAAGGSAVMQGSTPAGGGPLGIASVDLLFPLVWTVKLHWQLLEHFSPGGGNFLTTTAGLGIVLE